MTVYDIPNIEHCTIETIGAIAYRLFAHEGWYIHQADTTPGGTEENPTKVYRTVAILFNNYDFSLVKITAESELPENAEICGGGDNDHAYN
jgi:hypothetical protein